MHLFICITFLYKEVKKKPSVSQNMILLTSFSNSFKKKNHKNACQFNNTFLNYMKMLSEKKNIVLLPTENLRQNIIKVTALPMRRKAYVSGIC